MNLEDRLRTHMHSGEDLFVDSGRDAGDITALGHRRTRRNQAGGAIAGGVLALGLVFGVSSAFGGDGDVARTAAPVGDSDLESAATGLADDLRTDTAHIPTFDDAASGIFDGPVPPFELVVGVDDGFAGLRITSGVATAIRSEDGLAWDEESTTGIPEAVDVRTLVHGDGVFAALFGSFDNATGLQSAFIGTSTNLREWHLEQILPDEPDVFLNGLAIGDDRVVSFAQSFARTEEEAESGVKTFAIVGPIGGPFEAVPFPDPAFGFDRVVHTSDGFATTVFTDGPPQTFVSADGRTWSASTVADPDASFATITEVNDRLVAVSNGDFGAAGTFRVLQSDDLGATWSDVVLPTALADQVWWSFEVISGGSSAAIMLSGEGAEEFSTRYELVATTGDEWRSIDLGPFVPTDATVSMVAVSVDEVLLQVFPASTEATDDDLAASSGVSDDDPISEPRTAQYVRVPLT